jgi:hypothetical protein
MREFEFKEEIQALPRPSSSYDNFAESFLRSLVAGNQPEALYWHGRLIGVGFAQGAWQPYEIVFNGQTFSENEWRRSLEDQEIRVLSITSQEAPVYQSEDTGGGHHRDPTQVVMEATFVISDPQGEREVRVRLTHHIRQTYQAFGSTVEIL